MIVRINDIVSATNKKKPQKKTPKEWGRSGHATFLKRGGAF